MLEREHISTDNDIIKDSNRLPMHTLDLRERKRSEVIPHVAYHKMGQHLKEDMKTQNHNFGLSTEWNNIVIPDLLVSIIEKWM